MNHRALPFILLLLLIILAIPTVTPAAKAKETDRGVKLTEKTSSSGQRVALVIGNSSYRSSPLKNPANDARAVAATLRRLGFEVEEKTNLGFAQMNKSVDAFGKKLKAGGVGFFYYAGHGMQVNGANYLIPVDADIEDENEIRYKAVDAGLVLAKMESARSDVNIVVLDACRDTPYARSFRSTSHGLASMDAPAGSFIAYATAPGKTAADGSGSNGLYTAEMVKVLETPGLTLEQVFKRTLKAVREKSGSKQTPWVASNLEGEFYFIPPAEMTDLQPSAVQPRPVISAPEPVVASRGFKDPTTGMEFLPVPGGCFQMGDTFGDNKPGMVFSSDEHPVHEVCVDGFSMGKYEVTQGEWQQVMESNPSQHTNCGESCPVEQVSWNDVHEFIGKLNRQSGKKYRLPTEAEWEYAARSGGKSEKYSGSDTSESVAWYDDNSGKKTHPVGQKQANGLGLFDMSGNVGEWVGDWYDDKYYGNSPRRDPQGPSSGSDRVNRGGSWHRGTASARTSFRSDGGPAFRYSYIGFRLVAPVQ